MASGTLTEQIISLRSVGVSVTFSLVLECS
jgi:hypothetical protein